MVGGAELKRYLTMARGSCCEVEVLLEFVKDFKMISNEQYEIKIKQYDEIGKMLTVLIKSIN